MGKNDMKELLDKIDELTEKTIIGRLQDRAAQKSIKKARGMGAMRAQLSNKYERFLFLVDRFRQMVVEDTGSALKVPAYDYNNMLNGWISAAKDLQKDLARLDKETKAQFK